MKNNENVSSFNQLDDTDKYKGKETGVFAKQKVFACRCTKRCKGRPGVGHGPCGKDRRHIKELRRKKIELD